MNPKTITQPACAETVAMLTRQRDEARADADMLAEALRNISANLGGTDDREARWRDSKRRADAAIAAHEAAR